MGLDELKKEIMDKAETQAAILLSEARQEAKKLFQDASDKAKQMSKDAEAKTDVEAKEIEAEYLAAARLEVKTIESEAKRQLVNSVFKALCTKLGVFASSKEYEKVFSSLVTEGKKELGGESVLIVSSKDQALAKKYGAVSKEKIDSLGGVIVATEDGRIRMNNSFEALIEEKKELLRQMIFDEVFPEPMAKQIKTVKKKVVKKKK
ncbi:MAG: V-type ATP synthase subunit E family protein [Candidatus Micrarchaeota archaeon]